ncbi:von Willebrand factor-like [Gigantopelta aegis]|uniref:von Willebrand factor-like n=1 Tax=Gigantopelta aegis TaxID=1735272 RepID=UPI001B88BEA6|nr:von Willebrand factor-like [Gigantopelta aegis]
MDKSVLFVLVTFLAYSAAPAFGTRHAEHTLNARLQSRFRRGIPDKDLGDVIKICSQNPVDLAFVVDASRSIGRRNFTIGLGFVQDMVRMYDIAPDMVRIAVTTFGYGVYEGASFSFSRYKTQPEVLEAIAQLYYYEGGRTDTGDAIAYMEKKQMVEARPEVPHVAIVLTDGTSQRRYFTRDMAKRARDSGIKMFAVGVGRWVKEEELINIAGDPSRVFRVTNYEELKTIKEELAYQTCYEKPKPTPPPKAEPCGSKHPSDIYFVMDQVALGQDGVGWTTQFMSHTVDQEQMGEGMQFGLISGICPFDSGFSLDTYSQSLSLKKRIRQNGSPKRLAQLVGQLLTSAFSESQGHRPDSRKVGVIFLGGKMDTRALLDEMKAAAINGVKLFFANTGNVSQDVLDKLSLMGTVLEGQSTREQSAIFTNLLCPPQN